MCSCNLRLPSSICALSGLQIGQTCRLKLQSSISTSRGTVTSVQLQPEAMADVLQVYDLLMFNYVEDDDAMFR